MTTKILDGKALANELCADIKKQVEQLPVPPRLDVIWVGDNPASQIYVSHKEKAGKSVGINVQIHHFPQTITQKKLIAFIQQLNRNKEVDGILVQLPLPEPLNEQLVLEEIEPEKDVDGLTSFNLGCLLNGYSKIVPCTPMACLKLIQLAEPDLTGKIALIVGRSRLVGKPLAQLLLTKNCTIIQAHSKTKNLSNLCRMADILVVAAGKAGLIKGEDIKLGAIVIDVGINRLADGHVVGDVKTEEAMGIAGAVTPVPGGVGPMTVAMLLNNVLQIAKQKNS